MCSLFTTLEFGKCLWKKLFPYFITVVRIIIKVASHYRIPSIHSVTYCTTNLIRSSLDETLISIFKNQNYWSIEISIFISSRSQSIISSFSLYKACRDLVLIGKKCVNCITLARFRSSYKTFVSLHSPWLKPRSQHTSSCFFFLFPRGPIAIVSFLSRIICCSFLFLF